MPTEKWFVWWKRNRNHKGEEIVYSEKKAMALVEEKKNLVLRRLDIINCRATIR